jgi:uncharacterized protein with FMN-binding domain
MKKVTVISSVILAVASITVASATYLTSNSKQVELERATRLSDLSVTAVKSGNFELACKAQSQVVDALVKVHTKGDDLVGLAVKQKEDVCRKAAVSAMNEYRFITG